MKGHLLFVMTGARSVAGGIATSNLNNLCALQDLASEKGMELEIFSYLERDQDRPPVLRPETSFTGFGRRKWALAAALLFRMNQRPIFIFDHVRLAFPLLPLVMLRLIKIIIFAHGSEAWKRMRRASRWSFESAPLCLANSQFTLRKMSERITHFNGIACPLGLSPDFNSNGKFEASPSNLPELEAVDQKRRQLGQKVLLLVARMDSREGQKGHRALIKILPDLLRKFPDVQLVFPGPGDDRENLKKLAQSQGVASVVFIPGWVSHSVLRSLYQQCYAFVMPSRQEGFGLVYLEAMSYAKACVGCFDQGAEDIIVHGETGFLVQDPDNREELLGVLTRLLENPEETSRLGQKGFERLHQHFTARHYQERVKTQIGRVLSSQGERSLLRRFLMGNRLRLLAEKKSLYESLVPDTEIVRRQIQRFNTVWERCLKTTPFYQDWQRKYELPRQINRLTDLQMFPVLTKRVIQENHDLIFQKGRIRRYISTGGSTGEPTRFPSSPTDAIFTYADIYVGRSWFGIQPFDPLLLFWGHSHLFGTGLKGRLNNYKRKFYDFLLQTKRLNAYDMTAQTIERYYEVYRRTNPVFILGYPSCLFKLAKYIAENRLDGGKKDKLKVVIVTSETVTLSDLELFQRVFKVPVAVEYGMAETGVIGYSKGNPENIKIFWDSFVATKGPEKVLYVTTIYNRFFPLINYCTDDRVEVKKEIEGSILEVSGVLGRKQDVLRIGSLGNSCLELSGILMVHILKSYPHIFSIQFKQLGSNRVRIFLTADRELDLENVRRYFFKEIQKDHPSIDTRCIEFVQIKTVPKTLAGKEAVVV